jgi:hypothetical protein
MDPGGTLGGRKSPQTIVQAILTGGLQGGDHLPVKPLGLEPAAFLGCELERRFVRHGERSDGARLRFDQSRVMQTL